MLAVSLTALTSLPIRLTAVATPPEVLATSCFSRSLVLICCATPVICTSCWVNWLESSGDSGSWFFSCVVSSARKVLKFDARSARPSAVLSLLAGAAAAAVGVVAGAVLVTVMALDPDVHARGRAAAQVGLGEAGGVRLAVQD